MTKDEAASILSLDIALKALEFYASDESHCNRYGGWSANDGTRVNLDNGRQAKEALARISDLKSSLAQPPKNERSETPVNLGNVEDSGAGNGPRHETRDPRIDPRPRDVVRKGKWKRHVQQRKGNEVYYLRHEDETPIADPRLRNCWITSWQDWCRGADVLLIGVGKDEAGKK